MNCAVMLHHGSVLTRLHAAQQPRHPPPLLQRPLLPLQQLRHPQLLPQRPLRPLQHQQHLQVHTCPCVLMEGLVPWVESSH